MRDWWRDEHLIKLARDWPPARRFAVFQQIVEMVRGKPRSIQWMVANNVYHDQAIKIALADALREGHIVEVDNPSKKRGEQVKLYQLSSEHGSLPQPSPTGRPSGRREDR